MPFPASDYQEQASGARWWGPWRNDTDDNAIVVRGVNNNTTDTQAISDAVTQLNTYGKGKLVLEGTFPRSIPADSRSSDFAPVAFAARKAAGRSIPRSPRSPRFVPRRSRSFPPIRWPN